MFRGAVFFRTRCSRYTQVQYLLRYTQVQYLLNPAVKAGQRKCGMYAKSGQLTPVSIQVQKLSKQVTALR